MLSWVFGGKRSDTPVHKAPPYDQARDTAASSDAKARADLARCEDLPPEFLYYFATDGDDDVRAAVAANPGTPLQADVILARDRVTAVRSVLAEKIAKILPDIRGDQTEKLAELAFEVLEILADDQSSQVRQIVADSVKTLDNVPKPIVSLLARDVEDMVAMPVIEYSPLLEEQDLLNLIFTGIRGKRLAAVSRREDLTPELIDTIVDTKDDLAVETLIGNEQADISERTFESIVDASEGRESWQSALASRVRIPKDTLLRLSRIATDSVLKRLCDRADLGDELQSQLETTVEEKVTQAIAAEPNVEDIDAAMDEMKARHEAGELTEAVVLSLIADRKMEHLHAALSLLAEQPAGEIRRVLNLKSAKSVLALSWSCGLSVKAAVALQEKVVNLTSSQIMRASAGGGYPLNEDDLSWQAELLFA